MWKLTIIQEKKYEYSGSGYEESIALVHDDIFYLASLVLKMQECNEAAISYRIENVKKEGEN